MSIRSTIISQFEQVVKEQNKQLVLLTDDSVLPGVGSRLSGLRNYRRSS